MPKRLQKDESSATETYAKFVADPFETGYGHTVGNSLRRVLLSSLEGAAITSLKVDGAMHEFATVEGVVEDVTDIVLNLKKIKFKAHTRDEQTLLLSVNKEGNVTAADIQTNQNIELVNPTAHICTLDKKKKFEMELTVKVGRGFCPSDENKKPGQAIGIVAIDSIFSPVTRVRYAVEAARVGNRTDYDRLVLEIWTDGRITPDDALTQAVLHRDQLLHLAFEHLGDGDAGPLGDDGGDVFFVYLFLEHSVGGFGVGRCGFGELAEFGFCLGDLAVLEFGGAL